MWAANRNQDRIWYKKVRVVPYEWIQTRSVKSLKSSDVLQLPDIAPSWWLKNRGNFSPTSITRGWKGAPIIHHYRQIWKLTLLSQSQHWYSNVWPICILFIRWMREKNFGFFQFLGTTEGSEIASEDLGLGVRLIWNRGFYSREFLSSMCILFKTLVNYLYLLVIHCQIHTNS